MQTLWKIWMRWSLRPLGQSPDVGQWQVHQEVCVWMEHGCWEPESHQADRVWQGSLSDPSHCCTLPLTVPAASLCLSLVPPVMSDSLLSDRVPHSSPNQLWTTGSLEATLYLLFLFVWVLVFGLVQFSSTDTITSLWREVRAKPPSGYMGTLNCDCDFFLLKEGKKNSYGLSSIDTSSCQRASSSIKPDNSANLTVIADVDHPINNLLPPVPFLHPNFSKYRIHGEQALL